MSQIIADAIAPERDRKSFQYAGHYRSNHQYSPVHLSLDAALKHFYSKSNLATVLLKKGLLDFNNLYLLDHATVDVWANVVWVKIPKWIQLSSEAMLQKAPQHFCRFISKKDFLEAVIEYAQLTGHQTIARRCKSNPTRMLVQSSKGNGVYQLSTTKYACECDCSAYFGLKRAYTEDCYLRGLINRHPVLRGQLPDKHVFSVWASWGAKDFRHYQYEQGRRTLSSFGLSLDYIVPGHFTVYHKSRKLGSVDFKSDANGKEFWINQRQLTMLRVVPGDRIEYATAEEAAIALAQLLKVIDDGSLAHADLFGGGWDEQPQHLIEPHAEFIDDINQDNTPQLVSASGLPKKQRDQEGGFSF